MDKALDIQTANPRAGHYTQRRFSNDQVSKKIAGILTLGKIKPRPRKKEMFMKVSSEPMPLEPPWYLPSPQKPKKILSTQQQWQQQQQIITKRQWQLQQLKYTPKSAQKNSPSLARATSHSVLTEAMRGKFSDDESYSSDFSDKEAIAVSHTKDRRFKKFGSDWNLSKNENVGNRQNAKSKSSTLPDFTRGKFKSESNLRDAKFDHQPPALPPRNNPFKNSYVRKVEIQRPRMGEYGIAIDCTKVNPSSAGSMSLKVQDFPFILAIDPKGPMGRTNVKSGDYLLKVNDIPTEGINSAVLEALIKTSKKLQLVVATFQPINQSVPNTPVARVNDSIFDTLPPRPLVHGAKFHTLERISSPRTNGIYEVINETSSDSSHSQTTVKQRDLSGPKGREAQVLEDTKIDFMPIAKAVIGLKPKTKPETHTKNQNSLSENSSGFVSEAESHENSSGGSVGIPNQEDKNTNPVKPITNSTLTGKQIPEGTIYINKLEGPPPLPPKKIHLTKTATFPLGVYQNETSKHCEFKKSAPTLGERASNPDVSFVSLSISLPKGNKPFHPVVDKLRQNFGRDIQDDDVFIDPASNTGVRIIFPKSSHTQPSVDTLEGRNEFADQSSKFKQNIKKLHFSRGDEEAPSLVLEPPDDFADSRSETARPRLQSLPLVTIDKELRPALNLPNVLSSSKVIYSGAKVTEKASKSDLNLWSLDEVLVWLWSIGLDEKVIRSFNSSRVDGKALLAMKRADLIALGLKDMEKRRDFERALKRVQLRNL